MAGFWNTFSQPTDEQFALLGKVTAAWGIIDFELTVVISRLALAPDFLGLSMVDELGFPQRIRTIKNLLDIHRRRYHPPKIDPDALALADQLVSKLGSSKEARNRIAHQIWMRSHDEELFSVKIKGQQHDPKKQPPKMIFSNADLIETAADAMTLIEQIEHLIGRLPAVAEVQPPPPSQRIA